MAKAGAITALVGHSGSGKSTAASLIPRFYDVQDGAVKIGGVDIREIPQGDLMKMVAFVFQDPKLFKDSLLENIRAGRPSATREEVLKAAHLAQCDDILKKLPNGIDTIIGSQGIYLSGGETQRISIARMILKNAPIVILDEATAFTDPESEEQIQQLENAGVKVVVSDAQDIKGVYEAVNMIGKLLGKEKEADLICDAMQTTFDAVSAQVTDDGEEKTVYFEVSPLEYGLWTAGSHTFMDEIAQMLGLKNAFADVEGWAAISEEQVLERNPDYIVTISMYFGEGPTPEEEILSRTGWENVTAVKNGKILNLPNNELSRPAPRLADGAKALYDFVYGE